MNSFPDNKKFAFSILDDTDLSTVENTAPMYRLLTELGMRTTKTVWPLASVAEGKFGGSSLQEPQYRAFILELRDAGFEIAMHGARNHDSMRESTRVAFEEFQRIVGANPRIHANHSRNRDNIYWGAARFHFLKSAYALLSLVTKDRRFQGHITDSPFFWGDLCQEKLDYVRNFTFREVNLSRVNPTMPYHEPHKPYVKYWFSSCDASDVESFCELLSDASQERLERESGVCIVYTHFGCGFVQRGQVHPKVEEVLRSLASRDGWFVPVSTLLDHLRNRLGPCNIPESELAFMEIRWAWDRVASAISRAFNRPKDFRCEPGLLQEAPSEVAQ